MMPLCWERKSDTRRQAFSRSPLAGAACQPPASSSVYCKQAAVAAAGNVKRITSCTGGIFPGKTHWTPGAQRGKTLPELALGSFALVLQQSSAQSSKMKISLLEKGTELAFSLLIAQLNFT